MHRLVAILVVLLSAVAAQAQKSGPIYVECNTKKCNGSFFIENEQLVPMSFTIEANNGTQFTSLNPLTNSEHLEISQKSGRLSPKESRQIDFKLKCDTAPCNLTLLTGFMTGKHTADGVAVRMILPFTIYACDRGKDCRRAALNSAGLAAKK